MPHRADPAVGHGACAACHRIGILEDAIAPLAPAPPKAVRDRLHKALSIVYGIEPFIILRHIWGAPDREVERIALWMADALVDAALRDAGELAAMSKAGGKTAARSPAAKKPRP